MTAAPHRAFAVTTQDRIAGWFVIGAMLILLIGFIVPWVRTLAEDEQLLFETRLDRTYGITTEAIVSLRGVTVGNVRTLALDDAPRWPNPVQPTLAALPRGFDPPVSDCHDEPP